MITCPCCQLTSHHPDDAANGYCGRCHWWTSDPELAPYHFALPCEHRGQGVQLPRLGDWYRETHIIVRPDNGPFSTPAFLPVEFPLPFEADTRDRAAQWLHTQPGTLLELTGTIRRRPLPWWRRWQWKRHIRALRRLIERIFNGNG